MTGPAGPKGDKGEVGPAPDTTKFMVKDADTGTAGRLGAGTTAPTTALDVEGGGTIRSNKNGSNDNPNLLLRANYPNAYGWKLSTVDRGGGIDLDFWSSNGSDTFTRLLTLSHQVNSARPTASVLGDLNVTGAITVAGLGVGALELPRYSLPAGWHLNDTAGNDGMGLFYAQADNTETSVVALTVADNADDSIFIGGSSICCGAPNHRGLRVYAGGDAYLSGAFFSNQGAVWGDVAEHVPVADDVVGPGDVIAIDPASGRFRLARRANDSTVAGVVSQAPSVVLNDPRQGHPIALVGNVAVKVTARGGRIRPGDLLTTSSVPGRAMKAKNPRPGTILGKALGSLDKGEGVMRVWITLR